MPVTYADVWEYWLRNREVYDAVDFVTIHILPYWEDFQFARVTQPRILTPSESRSQRPFPPRKS